MKRNLTIKISDDLREALYQISKDERVTVSEMIRKSIRRYASIYRFRQLRNRVLPYAAKRALWEDKEDLAAFRERANEPTMTYEELLKDLKVHGKI